MQNAYDFALSLSAAVSAVIFYAVGQGRSVDDHVLRLSATILFILIVGQLPLSCAMWLLDDLHPTDEG